MRIIHILNHCQRGHGNAHVAVDLACEQARQGHAVAYVSGGGDLANLLRSHGVELFELDQTTHRYLRWPAMVMRFRRIMDEFQPEIVHAHMMTGAVVGYLATRLKAGRLVTHVHNSFDRHSTIMRLGDRIIAVSNAVAQSCIARGMPKKRLRVVLNGTIGTPRLSYPAPAALSLLHPNVGAVSGLHPRKAIGDLISAFSILFRSLPHAHLYIVGDGPSRQAYEEQAAGSSAGANIHFVGGVEDPRPYMASFDVFALASHADPCPLVIGEARFEGCAIVATNVDGIPETLDGGRAGQLVPPSDPDAMAGALLAVFATPNTLDEARRRARQGVDKFSVGRVAHEVENIYREVLAEQPAPIRYRLV